MLQLQGLRHRLIVSCQAPAGSPLRDTAHMLAIARAALAGGASAIRAEGIDDVAAMASLPVPIIGLIKRDEPDSDVYITPSVADVLALCRAGAAIVAADATGRRRASGEPTSALVAAAHEHGALFMADVDSLEAARHAVASGADIISTTLSGYTGGPLPDGPDVGLVRELAAALDIPIMAEGRYRSTNDVARAFAAGAYSVVVGGAITDPIQITARFVAVCPQAGEGAAA